MTLASLLISIGVPRARARRIVRRLATPRVVPLGRTWLPPRRSWRVPVAPPGRIGRSRRQLAPWRRRWED